MLLELPQTMNGKTAIISGSSTGIGAAIAIELSRRGASIVLNYPFSSLEHECKETGKQLSTLWIAVCADLSTTNGPAHLVAAAVERFGIIHILVNNAGRIPHGPTWETDVDAWDAAMNLNARGTFLLTKAVLPHLPPYKPSSPPALSGVAGGSRIICIGSGTSRAPQPEVIAYSATKGAIDTMIRVWARELPPIYGCTVNGVAPGPVDTKSSRSSAGDQFQAQLDGFSAVTPCEGAMASVEDVAWTVAFLAEDRSRWINGEYIMVNGGLIMA
ncbi:hypothetical protein G7054_g12743 [Neopestalotiopsis clavispora]|nr:hypothetical protein G7054_g12743 [Neopestalotiopsis clavispora]